MGLWQELSLLIESSSMAAGDKSTRGKRSGFDWRGLRIGDWGLGREGERPAKQSIQLASFDEPAATMD